MLSMSSWTFYKFGDGLRNSVLYSSPTPNERSGGTSVLWGLIYITGRAPASHVKVLHDSAYMGNSRPVGSLVSTAFIVSTLLTMQRCCFSTPNPNHLHESVRVPRQSHRRRYINICDNFMSRS